VLFGLLRVVDRDASSSSEPVALNPVADAVPTVGSGRAVLSLRRTAAELSGRMNRSSLASSLQPVLAAMSPASCLAVSIDGVALDLPAGPPAIPASTVKVLIAVAALDILGPEFRFVTTVMGPAPIDGVVNGDVIVVGGGDPVLSSDWYPASGMERHPVMSPTSLNQLAQAMASGGVTAITGRVLGDGSRYDDEYEVVDWADDIFGIEAGPYDALMANDARVEGDQYRWDDPVAAAAAEFRLRLGVVGISSSGSGGQSSPAVDAVELARVESAPLTNVVEEMLMTSDNNTAEMLVKELGVAVYGIGSRVDGLSAVSSALTRRGVTIDGMTLVDGSGLASSTQVKCESLVEAIDRAPDGVIDGLPVAGVSGTLSQIFVGSPVEGRLRGKTGTLGNPPYDQDPPAVKALAGQVMSDGSEQITFALLLNQSLVNDQSVYRPIWDALAAAFAAYPAGIGVAELAP
jgi:D-alanyl-D-alanine carboxypeptidase/D-alanyl-D-alanine-endopeptidase (penicillin-binding protein 4)